MHRQHQFVFLQNKASQEDVGAQLLVAKEYLSGKQIQASKQISYDYFKLASDQGNAEASYFLAKDEQTINPWSEKSLFYFDRAAHQKHLQSIWLLFEHYHYGEFCQELQKKALIYLRLGAELDHTKCQYHLGEYYLRGFGGLTPSIEEAFKYFKLAAEKGHVGAFKSLQPRILHPSAQSVDISIYEETQDLSVLKRTLESWGHQPIFLEIPASHGKKLKLFVRLWSKILI
ncbi:tetratricopeptide repeat protein [Candidatus Protochlamydia naegleriophila]|nr:tetratricopeptide repeat protein [Candidatus Protochlamydia naegleriophila]